MAVASYLLFNFLQRPVSLLGQRRPRVETQTGSRRDADGFSDSLISLTLVQIPVFCAGWKTSDQVSQFKQTGTSW